MSSEKIEAFWVNATAFEVARVMAGETVEARFRDYDDADWTEHDRLGGFASSLTHPVSWFDMSGVRWFQCQVYREPSWYAERPDPGPGYRLLGKFPDEELKPGDEYFDRTTIKWRCSTNAKAGVRQPEEVWYRRRIEAVEPKFAVGQTVKVIGPKQIPALEWSSVGMAQYAGTTQTIDRVELLTNPPGTYYHLKGVVNWCFREDYLEAVKPEPKHYVLRAGDSCETPCGNRIRVIPKGGTQRFFNLKVGDVVKTIHGQTITITAKGFEVTQ
jgi:hypothetical protein